jgi:hypothetical protein
MQHWRTTHNHGKSALLSVTVLGLLFCGVGATRLHADIPTGTSAFLSKIEAGQSPSMFVVGSSLTRSSQSFWVTELQRTLRWIHGHDAIGEVLECTGLGMTVYEMSRTGCINERVGQQTPDAISLEVGWTDVKDELSLPNMQSGLEDIIDGIRQDSPETEIFLYVPGVPSHDLWLSYQESLRDAASRIRSVARSKGVRIVWSRDAFLSVYESLVADNRVGEWDRYVYDTHHPTLRAGVEFIIPAWLAALAGNEDARVVYRPEMPRVCTKYRAGLGIDKDNGHMEVYPGHVEVDQVEYFISVDGGTSFYPFSPDRFTASAFYWSMPETIGDRSAYTIKARVKVRSPQDGAEFISEPFETDAPSGQPMPLALQTLVGKHFEIGDSVRFDYVMDDNYVEQLEWHITFDGGMNWVAIENQETWRHTRIFHWIATETFKGYQTQSAVCMIRARDYTDHTYTDNTGIFTLGDPGTADVAFESGKAAPSDAKPGRWFVLPDATLRIPDGSRQRVELFSLRGQRLERWSGQGPARLRLPRGASGIVLRVRSEEGDTRTMIVPAGR